MPTDNGKAYFVDPLPFYAAAFSALNNAISSISGIQDFNGIPKPGSLMLAGFGLLALCRVRRMN